MTNLDTPIDSAESAGALPELATAASTSGRAANRAASDTPTAAVATIDTPTADWAPAHRAPVEVLASLPSDVRERARAAAIEDAGDAAQVGEPVDAHHEDAITVAIRFAAEIEGYRGWLWSVAVVQLEPGSVTISEVVLLPGADALVAPEWVPWRQRVESGDLGVGDVLLTPDDDIRLAPGYLASDDPAIEDVSHELGFGRPRVLSREGRSRAARRWRNSDFGPHDEVALAAPGHCGGCAFYLPLAGTMGAGFGVCGNKYSPADGHVVHVGYGCGAHSEAVAPKKSRGEPADAVIDEMALEVHRYNAEQPSASGDVES